ncbi:hypothetical protein [Embleya scabrispora]|uniref:hypothetical protein n=1 Tax=Embleya scabrispora TaxID=159449 RepID=UPI0003A35CDF|nr:hypothetical protein [Embleya scabrispora]
MPGKRMAVSMAAAAGVAVTVAAGFTFVPSDGGGTDRTAQAKANTRRFVLILAGAADHAESQRFDTEVAARTEALTSECMSSHGFRYTPKDPRSVVDTEDATDFSNPDYARTRGFGISVFARFVPATADVEYQRTLSAAVLKTYDERLAKCAENAQRTTEKEYGIAEANSQWDRLDGDVRRDPRYQSALRTWRTCAAEAGHPAESRLALIETLRRQYTPIMAGVRTGSTELPQDQLAALAAQNSEWRTFHQMEVDAATATFPCSQAADRTYVSVFLEHLNRIA